MFHVFKRYGTKMALEDISIDILHNEFLLVSGPSGAGKSTLLKLLYLGESISDGQIIVDGMNISRLSGRKIPTLRRLFGIVFQDFKLIQTKTVYENISLVLEVIGTETRLIPKKVRSVLRTVGMENKLESYPPGLSGGEQQRVAVARAVACEPKIILADEPTGNLDPESAEIVMNLLKGYHKKGATIILATHDRSLISSSNSRIIYLKEGKLVHEHLEGTNPEGPITLI